jgi:hypothetical protein
MKTLMNQTRETYSRLETTDFWSTQRWITVDVEEGQKGEELVAFAFWATSRLKLTCFASFEHHDTLGVTGRSRRIYQECQVLCRILRFRSSVFCRSRRVDDTCEVLRFVRWISLIAHKDDFIQRNANFLRRLLRIFDER